MKKLDGPYAVLITPFKGDKVDFDILSLEIDRINKSEVSGFVVNGSTSEFVDLSIDEQLSIIKFVCENKKEGKTIIAGASFSNYVDCVKLGNKAADYGCDYLLICPPYYFKHKKDEIENFYLKIADKVKIPVILYNIPFFTDEISLDVAVKLLKHNNIVGIKDSSANMKRLIHLKNMTDKSVLTGTDDIIAPAIIAGCDGSFTAFAAIYPDKISNLYKAFNDKDYDKLLKLQNELLPLLRKADSETFPRGYKDLLQEELKLEIKDKEL